MTAGVFSTGKRCALYVLATAVFFVLGLLLFFPTEAVRLRIEEDLSRQLHQPVQVGALQLGLPLAVKLASLQVPVDRLGPVKATHLRVSPQWSSLFSASPAVCITGELWQGKVEAVLSHTNRLQLQASGLTWQGAVPEMPSLGLAMALDKLDLEATVSVPVQLHQTTLALSSLTVSGMNALGAAQDTLSLGEVFLQIHQDKNQLQIDQLQSRGGDLVLNVDGHLIPGRQPELCRLDLTATLIPQTTTDPALTSLLQLVSPPTANGHFMLKIGGTLGQPVVR
nr:type II secretion system protein GspN [uncultured Desulfuromonas sp.]